MALETQHATYLARCRVEIEARLDWGPSDEWRSVDFEELSDLIAEKTGRTLGATTLKRVWGRVRYDSKPSQHTLDTLAAFVDAASWRAWKRDQQVSTPRPRRVMPSEQAPVAHATAWWGAGIALVSVIFIALVFFRDGNPVFADAALANVQFSSRKVSSGLPNSVVFDYRLAGIEADSFFIQQSWDARLRDRISPNDRQFTSIYYYPGHFWAKLIANDTVLEEHPLIVPTDGWLGLIDTEGPIPIYTDLDTTDTHALSVSASWLSKHDPGLLQGEHILNYYYVGVFDPVSSTSFVLQSEVKVEVEDGHGMCLESVIVLIGQHGRIAVPFSIPGCSANLYMVAGDQEVSGRTQDLSSLGTDLSDWKALTIAVQEQLVSIAIEGEEVYQLVYTRDLGDIVGLRYRFRGLGMIRKVSLGDGQGTFYLDGFTE